MISFSFSFKPRVNKDDKELLDLQDYQESRVHQAIVGLRAEQGLLEHQACPGLKEQREAKEVMGQLV